MHLFKQEEAGEFGCGLESLGPATFVLAVG